MKAKGYRMGGERWRFMKDAWDYCIRNGEKFPEAVKSYFSYKEPGRPELIEINIEKSHRNFVTFDGSGIEIDVQSIPKGVDRIRIYS